MSEYDPESSFSSTSRGRSSTEEDGPVLSPHDEDSPFEVPSLPEGVGLKPHLESIFADVQANLPSVDFDGSDISSDDEDVAILSRSFHRPKTHKPRTPTFTPERWRSVLESDLSISQETPTYQFVDVNGASDQSTDGKDSGVSDSGLDGNKYIAPVPLTQQALPLYQVSPMVASDDDGEDEQIEEIMRFEKSLLDSSDLDPKIQTLLQDSVLHREDWNEPTNVTGAMEIENKLPSTLPVQKEDDIVFNLMPHDAPRLVTDSIDHIDLDLLLDAFPERQRQFQHEGQRGVYKPASSHGATPNLGEGDATNITDSNLLMDQLTQLCIKQSGGSVSADELQPKQKENHRNTSKPRNREIKIAWDDGNKLSEDMTKEDLSVDLSSLRMTPSPDTSEVNGSRATVDQQSSGRDTVFLDLRAQVEQDEEHSVEVSDAVRRILQQHSPSKGSSDSSDNESDDEDPRLAWRRQKDIAIQQVAHAQGKQGTPSIPPQQITPRDERNAAIMEGRDVTVTPPRVQDISTVEKRNHVMDTRSHRSMSDIPPTPPQSPADMASPARRDSHATLDQEKLNQAEMVKKLREKKEQERQGRMRLMKQLQAMRPQGTTKFPPAKATPVVFDLETSYSPSPETLPSSISSDSECALLTARLSKLGELIPHRSSGSRFLEGSGGMSASYFALLSFFLSLVPDNLRFLKDDSQEKKSEGKYLDDIPFRVVGMQQVCQDGELILQVAIVPKIAEESSFQPNKMRRSHVRTELKAFSPFQQIVNRFLTISTLQTVCPWMDDLSLYTISSDGQLINIPPDSRNESVLIDGTYIPPVPQTTTKPLSTYLSLNPDVKVAERVFSIPVGFFWHTAQTQESACQYIAPTVGYDIIDVQNTISLIYKQMYRNPYNMMSTFHRILQEGLDLSGFRLLYVDNTILKNPSAIHNPSKQGCDALKENTLEDSPSIGPILAVALRGCQARTKWLDVVGPSDPILARKTDPKSLMAMFGGSSRDELFIYCPRNPSRVHYDLALWFGGRVPASGTIDVKAAEPFVRSSQKEMKKTESPKGRKGKKGSKINSPIAQPEEDEFAVQRTPVSTLIASTHGDIFLTVSPVVPPLCLGIIVSTCHKRGYQVCGVKRLRLNSKRANGLGLSGPQVHIFSPISCTTPTSPKNYEEALKTQLESGLGTTTSCPMPSCILLLRKENAMHHATSLQEALMLDLSLHGLLTTVEKNCDTHLRANLCFHVTPFSESLLCTLGGDFSQIYPQETHSCSFVPSSFYSNPELEQIVVVAFAGSSALRRVGDSISKLLGLKSLEPSSQKQRVKEGLELLGLKFIPSLSTFHAKELSPFEIGDYNWQASIQTLVSKSVLICVVRGVNAFVHIRDFAHTPPSPRRVGSRPPVDTLEVLISVSPEIAYRQASIFFRDQELFADPSMRVNLKYFPPLRNPSLEDLSTARFSWTEEPSLSPSSKKTRGSKGTIIVEESIFKTMLAGPRLLTTILVVKPFAVYKHLSKILKRILNEDFNVVGLRLLMLTPIQAAHLVPSAERPDRVLSSMHVEHLMLGPCLVLCLQRENAVKKLLDLLGPSHPQEAKRMNQFYWRGLYGADPINNALHASECYSDAVSEVKLFFPDGLSCPCTPDLNADDVLAPGVDSELGKEMSKGRKFTVRKSIEGSDSTISLVSSFGSNISFEAFTSPRSSQGVSATPSELYLPTHSALCQTNCLLLAPPLQVVYVRGHRKGYAEVIDALLSQGFEFVGMRMVWLVREQAEEFCSLYHGSFPNLVNILCRGPCIVLAVQRDNAVSCLDSLLGSPHQKDSVISKYGDNIFRPKSADEAARHLEFFFEELMPHCQGFMKKTLGSMSHCRKVLSEGEAQ